MPSNEEANDKQQLGELRSDVRHLQSDVTDLRAEVRAVSQKVDTLRVDLTGRTDAVRADLTGAIDRLRSELTGKIDAVKDSVASAKVWALVLYIGLAAAILLTMAHGFKWL